MMQIEIDKEIVDELRKIMWKHRRIGAMRMYECVRLALEGEQRYVAKSKPRNNQVDGGKRKVTNKPRTRSVAT